ncbi:MAG TPA: NAD(P)H-dependent glycerol-3-phosphate dehydrogenase [Planctomycetota bacterium]|nr:NAD(P)H-dependent glycerol-3-phosphate dehydrogenase [Planctomycetota bacterium]
MTLDREKVAVLGSGSFGTTVAHVIASTGRTCWLWGRDAEVTAAINEKHKNPRYFSDRALAPTIRATSELEEAARNAQVVVVAVASSAFREVTKSLGDFVTGDQILLSATKGLEPRTHKRMSEILKEETCAKKVGAVSGPNIAKEILVGQPAATVVASRFKDAIEISAHLLSGPRFRVYGNSDLVGVELAGALKNVIAIASGVATGLELGDNTRSLLITRGLAEIQRLGVKLGADPLTFSGLAGIGDLFVTCTSPLSRNHRVGAGLAKGEKLPQILERLGEVAEGVNTAKVCRELMVEKQVAMPIAESVYKLLYEDLSAKDVLEDLMTRRQRYEIDFDYSFEMPARR